MLALSPQSLALLVLLVGSCGTSCAFAPAHGILGWPESRRALGSLYERPARGQRTRWGNGAAGASALSLSDEQRAKWLKKAKTWSNVGGLVVTPVRENVWALERPFVWFDIDVGSKAAVVRLSDGSLWIHSPIELDADTKAAVDELGLVKHIVSPNYEHVKFARQWIEADPDATSYVCPGGKAKFPAIPYDREIGNEAPAEWLGEVAHPPPLPPPYFSPVAR